MITATLQDLLDRARADVQEDHDHWAREGCGQDTEEAEESGRLIGYAEGLTAALELAKQPTFVHVVEVFDRMDGIYVFASHDDAVAFQATVDGDAELLPAGSSRCSRTEEVVCSYADALKLIAAECEASEDATAFSLESGTPIATHAWAKDETAPEDLLCVEYVLYPADSEEGDGAKPSKRRLWVGLDPDSGAPNIDAGRDRLENEGWQVTDWGAA